MLKGCAEFATQHRLHRAVFPFADPLQRADSFAPLGHPVGRTKARSSKRPEGTPAASRDVVLPMSRPDGTGPKRFFTALRDFQFPSLFSRLWRSLHLHRSCFCHLIDLIHRKEHEEKKQYTEYKHDGITSPGLRNGIFSGVVGQVGDAHTVTRFVFVRLGRCFSLVRMPGVPVGIFNGQEIHLAGFYPDRTDLRNDTIDMDPCSFDTGSSPHSPNDQYSRESGKQDERYIDE